MVKSERGQSRPGLVQPGKNLNVQWDERYVDLDDGKGRGFYYYQRWRQIYHQIEQLGSVVARAVSLASDGPTTAFPGRGPSFFKN